MFMLVKLDERKLHSGFRAKNFAAFFNISLSSCTLANSPRNRNTSRRNCTNSIYLGPQDRVGPH
jgi:hypothetical protein